jgi:hypothetical protein
VKALLLVLAFALSLASGCGSNRCDEACAKAQRCGVVPGALGTDASSCAARCREATARTSGAVVTCIGASSCDQIRFGQCGSW